MNGGDFVTEFWLSEKLNQDEFVRTFESHFPGSQAKRKKVVPDARPGYRLFHLHIPIKCKDQLFPFLDQYAQEHGAVNEKEQAGVYPFNPLA